MMNSTKNRLEGLKLFLVLGSGHFLTLLGSAMTRFAFGVFVYQQTGQVEDFATVLIVGFLPGILISPLAGVWTDRYGARKLVLAGDVLGGAAMATVLPAVLADSFTITHLLIVTAILSCASALQRPALQALIPAIVPEEKVDKANGLFATLTSATEVLGPVFAGLLLGMGALSVVVGFDLVTYGAAILVTLSLWARLVPKAGAAGGHGHGEPSQSSWREDLMEGLRYLLASRPLLYLILLFTFLNFAIGFNTVLMPPFVLSMGNTAELGVVNGVFGVGMVLGGLIMSVWKYSMKRIPLVLLTCFGVGVAIAVSGLSRGVILMGLASITVGLLIPIINTPVVTILQLKTKPSHLGRVFSLAQMLAWISLPLGQILSGQMAESMLTASVAAEKVSAGLVVAGKPGVYGLLLLGTGLFMMLTVAAFSQVRSLSQLDEEGVLDEAAA